MLSQTNMTKYYTRLISSIRPSHVKKCLDKGRSPSFKEEWISLEYVDPYNRLNKVRREAERQLVALW